MPVEAIEINSWTHLLGELEPWLDSTFENSFYFRGQPDFTWGLIPSLSRSFGTVTSSQALHIESKLYFSFAEQAHLHLNMPKEVAPGETLTWWWTLMQHYNAPTRLLDWTGSPYVALYYAVKDRFSEPGMVWAFDSNLLHNHWPDEIRQSIQSGHMLDRWFRDAGSAAHYLPCRLSRPVERLIAQQARFTVCTQILGQHHRIFDWDDVGNYNRKRLLIPSRLKPEFLTRLRAMNISASALSPGLDGIGRNTAELLQMMANQISATNSANTAPPHIND